MNYKIYFLCCILFALNFVSCSFKNINEKLIKNKNELTEQEIEDGWKLIFGGTSFLGWFQIDNGTKIKGWEIINGYLVHKGKGGSLINETYLFDFELKFEWMLYPNANSGVLYFISSEYFDNNFSGKLEYQIIDEINYPDSLKPYQKTGSCYGLYPAFIAKPKPVGEYNISKIKVIGNHVEHWLNGNKVLEFVVDSEEWNQKVNHRIKTNPNFTFSRYGHIALQTHNGIVCFRNIKIREYK